MSDQDKKLQAIKDLIQSSQNSLASARKILATLVQGGNQDEQEFLPTGLMSYTSDDNKIVEGVFTGNGMLGADGNIYPVPANYASKSLIVQGSKLKATIDQNGKIIYKIIEEIPYEVRHGIITKSGEKYQITSEERTYNVLLAAITFHHVDIGDHVTIRVPMGKMATFAVIDTVVPKE